MISLHLTGYVCVSTDRQCGFVSTEKPRRVVCGGVCYLAFGVTHLDEILTETKSSG